MTEPTAPRAAWTPPARPELVLLDLDGTLSDSAAGIIASMRHAFAEHGLAQPSEQTLRTFVGPPFAVALAGLGYDEQLIDAVVTTYRSHYNAGGLFDTTLFSGVPEALAALQAGGVHLAVATSKPQETARRIVEHFGVGRYLARGLDAVFGADPHRRGDTKADVIGRALAALGPGATSGVVMVGDREHDVIGAATHGLPCVGVAWGYSEGSELIDSGAVAVVTTPAELVELLL